MQLNTTESWIHVDFIDHLRRNDKNQPHKVALLYLIVNATMRFFYFFIFLQIGFFYAVLCSFYMLKVHITLHREKKKVGILKIEMNSVIPVQLPWSV